MQTAENLIVLVLLLGGAAFLLATGLSYAISTSSRRLIAVLVVGCVAVTGIVAGWAAVDAPSALTCNDCGEVLGVWVSKIILFVYLPLDLIGWISGTLLGWTLRRPAGG